MKQGTLAIGKKVNVLGTPARNRFKDDALKPHWFGCEVLYVDFKEDLRTFFDR